MRPQLSIVGRNSTSNKRFNVNVLVKRYTSKWNNRTNEDAIQKAAADAIIAASSDYAMNYADSLTYGWWEFHISPGYYLKQAFNTK
jgi:hypothetical protein